VKQIEVVTIDDLYKARTRGAKDIKKRKRRVMKKYKAGDIIKFCRYKQFKLKVLKDLGDKVKVRNITGGYRAEPYTIDKI